MQVFMSSTIHLDKCLFWQRRRIHGFKIMMLSGCGKFCDRFFPHHYWIKMRTQAFQFVQYFISGIGPSDFMCLKRSYIAVGKQTGKSDQFAQNAQLKIQKFSHEWGAHAGAAIGSVVDSGKTGFNLFHQIGIKHQLLLLGECHD